MRAISGPATPEVASVVRNAGQHLNRAAKPSEGSGAAGAQRFGRAKQDASFMGQNCNVGTNQTKPERALDVNGNALICGPIQVNGDTSVRDGTLDAKSKATVGGDLDLGNSALYFTSSEHWLCRLHHPADDLAKHRLI
jgi:hypothetical protein